jgi:cleavage and polyadenylation specificity factor subunit 1
VITTFELPGCVDMWTVVGDKGSDVHDFLIMSLTNSTMVLETGEELNEVEQGGFVTNKPTVFACNLGNNRFIVQVSARHSLFLL